MLEIEFAPIIIRSYPALWVDQHKPAAVQNLIGRVRVDACAIPGLFACGNDMASIMRGTYPGPGITLGPALVFAYRAAMAAAGKAG